MVVYVSIIELCSSSLQNLLCMVGLALCLCVRLATLIVLHIGRLVNKIK